MRTSATQQDVIDSFRHVHGERFDYDSVQYVNSYTKVDIRCRNCGALFSQRPNAHLRGQGCLNCQRMKLANSKANIRKSHAEKIISRFQMIHGDKYDYSKVCYKGAEKRVEIGCRRCGIWFWTFPNNHLRGKGCQMCSQKDRGQRDKSVRAVDIIERFRAVHGDKYDYSNVIYDGSASKVKIRCKACDGFFFQSPACHLNGDGCKNCADKSRGEKRKNFAATQIVNEFIQMHGDRYDYSDMIYDGDDIKIKIKCNKCGRAFFQSPGHHKTGNGCPACRESTGEKLVAKILDKMGIEFERQKRFDGCRNKKRLPFDFYFSVMGCEFAVEYNGIQHYEPVEKWGGEEKFKQVVMRDTIKRKFCEERGIRLIEIPHYVISQKEIRNILSAQTNIQIGVAT